jgi:redox-sensitive bicupin YhaK (pirin superfamily)
MIKVRKSQERGFADHGWLKSYHTFSFAEYHDAAHMHYSVLRVMNEDIVAGGTGFGLHPHRDMEIITYILSGSLRHRDSMGNTSVIGVGDVQRMTAGTGVEHSEFNASSEEPVHLLQIWIFPNQKNLTPSYEEKHFSESQKENQWCLIAAPDGRDGAMTIHQDVFLSASLLEKNKTLKYAMGHKRGAFLQIAKGEIEVNKNVYSAGDALMIEEIQTIEIKALENAEILLFDLPI